MQRVLRREIKRGGELELSRTAPGINRLPPISSGFWGGVRGARKFLIVDFHSFDNQLEREVERQHVGAGG